MVPPKHNEIFDKKQSANIPLREYVVNVPWVRKYDTSFTPKKTQSVTVKEYRFVLCYSD